MYSHDAEGIWEKGTYDHDHLLYQELGDHFGIGAHCELFDGFRALIPALKGGFPKK